MSTFGYCMIALCVVLLALGLVGYGLALTAKDYDNDLSKDHETL